MDRRERFDDRTEALRTLLDGRQQSIWTAMPGIIESFDPATMTVTVQIALQGKQLMQDGTTKDITISIVPDVPVMFTGGGGLTLTFPIAKNDECLLVLASRCIDSWWQSGGVQPLAELRMHDLSDGFAIVGVRSQPRVIPNISITATELRTDDGTVKVSVLGGDTPEIDVQVTTDVTVKFTKTTIDLKVKANSAIHMEDGKLTFTATTITLNGIVWDTHEHTGVQAGGAKTGGPTSP